MLIMRLNKELMFVKISIAVLLLSLITGCHPLETPFKPPLETTDGIELILRTDKRVYREKEPIKMQLTVTNKGNEPFKYTFPSSQIYDFVVKKEGKVVWYWSVDKAFITVLTEWVLKPQYSIVYSETWDQKDIHGNFVPPGQYE